MPDSRSGYGAWAGGVGAWLICGLRAAEYFSASSPCCCSRPASGVANRIPSLDPIEDFEKESSKENLFRGLTSCVDHVPDQKLADPISSPVSVGKTVPRKDRVFRPRWRFATDTPMEDLLPRCRKAPVGVENWGRHQCSTAGNKNFTNAGHDCIL